MPKIPRPVLVVGVLMALAGTACDPSEDDGGTPGQPTNHLVANDQPGTIEPNQYLDIPFQVPASAMVAYQIVDRSSTDPDNFTAGILPESEVGYFMNKQKYNAFASMNGKAPLGAQAAVPAGAYHFFALCQNLLERCQFSVTVTALY
jgi:hypothetical protein